MCGISFVLDCGSAAALDVAAAMHAPIRHRGPDGEGFLTADRELHRFESLESIPGDSATRVAGAFRRLKIIDLSAAASQPMLSPSNDVAILFNGEIYNFRDLRQELERHGRTFHSASDTEVALAAYERWGTGCFAHLEGMWAIVLIDMRRRSIVVSRDRFGIKPLYWWSDRNRLLLASEIKQITAAIGSAEPNRALLGMFLGGVRQPTLEETFVAGIRAVPPATFAELPVDRIEAPEFRRYWDLASFSADANGSTLKYEAAVDQLDALLRNAVRYHAVADVPVGSLLSGGVDSSTIVSMLAEIDPTAPTYSFGFRDAEPDVCEMPYVDAVVKQYRLRNVETSFDPRWVAANTARVIRSLEEPVLGMPPLAQFRVFELCRERGTTVLLDGQGADEIFAGYPYHQQMFLADRRRRRRYGEFASELRAIANRSKRSALGILISDFAIPSIRHRLSLNGSSRPRWLDPAYGTRSGDSEYALAMNDRGSDASLVNRQVHFDLRWGNAKTILAFGDKNGMAHSLEVRVPFFDRKIVEFALSLPDTFKIHRGDRKRVLRDVARRRLPPMVTERPDRTGFAIPESDWLRGPLQRSIEETITDQTVSGARFVKAGTMERLRRDFVKGNWRALREAWRLYAAGVWANEFHLSL